MARGSAHGTQMLAQWTVKLIRDAELPARDEAKLFRKIGLDMKSLAAQGATIAHDAACTVWEELACDQPADFGVRFSERFDIRGLGLLGYLAAASRLPGDLLARVVRFH